MKAEIITIGDEILLGQIVDTNSAWIGAKLNTLNISVKQITSISDERGAIYQSLRLASSRADLIIVTGGLGPTKDDVTKETISTYFNSPLVRDEKVLSHVKGIFSRLGKEIPITNFAQADVLESADVLYNDVGTAPGMWVEYEGKYFVFLPGVPFEMKFLIENRVIPKLKSLLSSSIIYHAHIITVGLGESFLANQISDIEERLPATIKLAYLPRLGLVRLRLTAEGENFEKLQKEVESFQNEIVERLKEHVVAVQDITLEEAIIEEFTKHELKLATAESCTGGGIAAAITQYSGASSIFDCAIVAYHNTIKQQLLGVEMAVLEEFGAVSEQTVVQMAEGVKRLSGADYGIATSGIAGPTGGTPDKPVGTVWIAVAGKKETVTKKFEFHNNRIINIERSIAQSLILLWHLFKREMS